MIILDRECNILKVIKFNINAQSIIQIELCCIELNLKLYRYLSSIKVIFYIVMKTFQIQRAKVINSCFIDLSCIEESLMSLEKLDRASPDLWPEQSEYLFSGRSL